jgi:hypothetical protein
MSADTHDLKVESRLTRMETTVEMLADSQEAMSKQVLKTNETVDRLAVMAQGDRRLVKGFILAIGVMWGVAQFAVPLIQGDGSSEVVKILREMQTTEKRLKSMEDWAGAHIPAPVAPVR